MKKHELLAHWQSLEPNQNPLKVMQPIAYKHKGKTYGMDGIRIDGSMKFIDAVLSCLKPLIDGENVCTRLQLSHTDCEKSEGDFNKGNGGNAVYIRLCVRGDEGQMAAAIFDKHLHAPTERFAELIGA